MNRKVELWVLVILIIAGFFVFGSLHLPSGHVNANPAVGPTPTPRKTKFTDFPHSAKAHRLECNTCHKFPSPNWNKVRDAKTAFPDLTDYPHHETCVGCHKQQFFKGTPPKVCSICHTNPSPSDSSRHPFPNPRELFDQSPKGKVAKSDFVVGFPHDKHIDIVSVNPGKPDVFINAAFAREDRRRAAEESCSVCHQTMKPQGTSDDEYLTTPPPKLGDAFWLKKGTFKTAPIGHTVCFTCHSADTGILPAPESCGTCHHLQPPQPVSDFDAKLADTMIVDDKVMRDAWRIRHSAGAFRHEFFAHVDLSCSTCHSVTTMNTADPLTIKIPISACATCHATPTADDGGAINYEMDKRKAAPTFQCVKCHITFGKLPVPESHTKALSEATGGK